MEEKHLATNHEVRARKNRFLSPARAKQKSKLYNKVISK
jgi:hypothetical protein